jgi:hypothetical protein
MFPGEGRSPAGRAVVVELKAIDIQRFGSASVAKHALSPRTGFGLHRSAKHIFSIVRHNGYRNQSRMTKESVDWPNRLNVDPANIRIEENDGPCTNVGSERCQACRPLLSPVMTPATTPRNAGNLRLLG